MQKKLQQMISELKEISEIDFEIYESDGSCMASTCKTGHVIDWEQVELPQNGILYTQQEGVLVLPLMFGEEQLTLAAGATVEQLVSVRLAAKQITMLLENERKAIDKNSFAAALIAEEISSGEIYKRAARLKLKDVSRTVYLFELAQTIKDEGAAHMLERLFADGRQDMLFMKDETHLVLVKAHEKGTSPEQQKTYALHTVDTMNSELMIKTRVAYSTVKETLGELADAYKEAMMALRIAGLFQEHKEVASYARLGIARLIYELPKDLCEMFLHEVFGEKIPDQEIDEEMQVMIRKFFDNDLNIAETARQLYLHRNTLVYKLERFEKLMGLDIRRFDDAMTFQIAMMVLSHYRSL